MKMISHSGKNSIAIVMISEDKQPDSSWYWEMLVSIPSQPFDLISFYLFENGASGVEEIDEDGHHINCRIFFPSTVSDPALEIQMAEDLAGKSEDGSVRIKSLVRKPFQNWQEGWQSFFKPVEIGASFLIRPPWETSTPGRKEIVIQPGQGFGTGYHESTHLALLMLERTMQEQPAENVLDVGTGSGILAIAALLLGARKLVGVDLDADALAEVPYNLDLSGLNRKDIKLIQCGPGALKQPVELVVANIEGHFLEQLAVDLQRLTASGGRLVLSGVLTEYRNRLLENFKPRFEVIHLLEMNEWSGILLGES